jgi:hypothetical protein
MVATLFALLGDMVVTPALLVSVRFPASEAARLGRLGTGDTDGGGQPTE